MLKIKGQKEGKEYLFSVTNKKNIFVAL